MLQYHDSHACTLVYLKALKPACGHGVIVKLCPLAVILVQEVLVSNADEVITLIEEEAAGISIPREVFSSLKEKRVRVASTLFRNMTGFLPESLKEETSNASLRLVDKQA